MKKMKLFNWLLIPSLALAMTACTDNEEIEGDGHGYDEATFFLEAVSVGNTSATVKASVTGNVEAPYICFFTDDVTSPASTAVSNYLKTISVSRHILSTGTNTYTADELRQGGKKYRCIMTGLLANGRTYNDPVVLEFATAGDFEKAAWTLSYPNPDDQPTFVTLSGIPTDYVYGFMTKAEWEETDIKTIANAKLDGKYTVSSGDVKVSLPITETGDYVLYAFGIDENAAPTLAYATLAFNVAKIDYSAYNAFLGTWYDAEGHKFVVSQKDLGATYNVKGFDVDIVAVYGAGTIKFYCDQFGTDADSGLPAYLFGWDQDGYIEDASQNDNEAYLLATGVMTEEGIAITGETYKATYSGTTYNEIIVGLQVLAYDETSGKGKQIGNKIQLAVPVTLTKTQQSDPPSGPVTYADFLGEWTVVRGTNTDTWTISQNVADESFVISGIEGIDIEVAALYDSEAKALVIPDQILGTFEDDDLGPMEASLHGKIYYQNKYYFITSSSYDDPYYIAAGTLSSDKKTMSLEGYSVNIEGIGELDLIGLQLFAEVLEGANQGKVYGFSSDFTALPNSLSRVGGGGGGGSDPASPYAAFLGNWNVQRGAVTDTWTIQKKVDGSSYTILGIEGMVDEEGTPDESMAVSAIFDSATSSIVINAQELTQWTSSTYGPILDMLRGVIEKDGKKSSVSGSYIICTGVATGGGSTIELTPAQVNLSSGGTYDIIGIQFFGKILEGEYAGYSLYYNEDYTTLPNTLTKAGSSAVTATRSGKAACKVEPTRALTADRAVVRFSRSAQMGFEGKQASGLKLRFRAR